MSPRAALAVTLVMVLAVSTAALMWTVRLKRALVDANSGEVSLRSDLAHDFLDAHLSDSRWGLERVALFVAADSRTRAAMTTEALDVTTLEDALGEVQEVASTELLALASVDGQVLAAKGPIAASAPRGLSLKGTPQFELVSQGRVTSTLWFQGEAAVLVSFAPVTSRDQLVGVALVGRLLDRRALNTIAQRSGGVVGLFGPHGEWFGSAKPNDPTALAKRPAQGFETVQLAVEPPPVAQPSMLWVPLVLVSVLVIWAATLALLLKRTEVEVEVETLQ